MILINYSAIMIVFNNGSSANGHQTTQSGRQIGELPKNNTLRLNHGQILMHQLGQSNTIVMSKRKENPNPK